MRNKEIEMDNNNNYIDFCFKQIMYDTRNYLLNEIELDKKCGFHQGKDTTLKNFSRSLFNWFNKVFFSKLGYRVMNTLKADEFLWRCIYDVDEKIVSINMVETIMNNHSVINKVYELLEDMDSKTTFDWIMKRRIAFAFVGNICEDIYPFSLINGLKINHYTDKAIKRKKIKNQMLFEPGGYKIIYSLKNYKSFNDSWVNRQYFLKNVFEPCSGDVVISAGAFYGETAIWFANVLGENSTVYSFEPADKYYNKLKENIRINKLGNIIKPIHSGLWHESGSLRFDLDEASSSINEYGHTTINVIKLDDFVKNNEIKKIDYIKMDIEGAEFNALQGAEKTIKKFKPGLAISVYHSWDDLLKIPLYLHSLIPEYKFYLSHKKSFMKETILFASCNSDFSSG